MTAYDTVLAALDRAGATMIVNGDTARAQCPAHDSHRLSLKVSRGRNGDRAVLHCHAGCSTDAVLAALGMSRRDLFDGAPPDSYRPPPAPVLTPWDRAMLELSERYGLGWRGPGDYPPIEHLLDRIVQHQRAEGDPPC